MTTGDMDRPGEGERPGAVDDAVWTELVAAFHASTADQPGRWPDAENLPGAGPRPHGGDGAQSGMAGTGAGPGPGFNATPATPSRVVRPASRPGQEQPPSAPPAVTWTAPGPRDWDSAPEPAEDGYTPPPPPPLPELGMVTKAAWIAGLGGPSYLTLATLLHWQTPQWAALLCVVAGVLGFAYLVTRLKDRPGGGDDDPDDPTYGAVL
ncbi:hypothetical protein KGA66_16210 [Actinocrinis puniceicyclus]|uniref:Uncharacterized protein n=1 Tax=Actinocrinis puniceicyclus TaxID=977794 RepID=A0A8J7WLL1_9ACTN|nr:hypothetical protein [Actinocrinis puniceicyclus]MBS2964601.1 hypothetical protein [Actinocrinis puniceicyclus]